MKKLVMYASLAWLLASSPSAARSLPFDVIVNSVAKIIVHFGGKTYSNNMQEALVEVCGSNSQACSSRQVCIHLNTTGFGEPMDCSIFSDEIVTVEPAERAFDNFINALYKITKPQSCVQYEAALLADAIAGTILINPDSPTMELGRLCGIDKEDLRRYAVNNRDEILRALGF